MGDPRTYTVGEGAKNVDVVVTAFTDDNPRPEIADFTASIDWNDGATLPGLVSSTTATANQFTVSGTRNYPEEGARPITVVVTDNGGFVLTISNTANVANAPIMAAGAASEILWPIRVGLDPKMLSCITGEGTRGMTDGWTGVSLTSCPSYEILARNG